MFAIARARFNKRHKKNKKLYQPTAEATQPCLPQSNGQDSIKSLPEAKPGMSESLSLLLRREARANAFL